MKKKGIRSFMLALALLLSGSLASGDTLLAQESVPTSSESQPIKAAVGKQNIYRDSGKVMGGQQTDGKDLYSIKFGKHDTFERLVIGIHEWVMDEKGISNQGPAAAIPCQFEVLYEEYPSRLYFDLEGVRWSSAKVPNLANSDYISGMYFIFPDSWGNQRLAVTFKKPIQYEIFELHNPARIVVDIKPKDRGALQFPPVYSLRSQSSDNQDELREELLYRLKGLKHQGDYWGIMKEIPKGKKVRILKSRDNKLFIEEGYYKSREDALKKQKYYAEEGVILFIEKRKVNEIPKVIHYNQSFAAKLKWAGEWRRLESTKHNQAIIKISNVSPKTFKFSITAVSGTNEGEMEGLAKIKGNRAYFSDKEKCKVTFELVGAYLKVEPTAGCQKYAGVGVIFAGTYLRGEKIPELTLRSRGIFPGETEEKAFAQMVEDDYDLFVDSMNLIIEEDDLDGLGAKVVSGMVRGVDTLIEAIIIYRDADNMWAAVIDKNAVKYFTTVPEFQNRLPRTIEKWRELFKEKQVLFMSAPKTPSQNPNTEVPKK